MGRVVTGYLPYVLVSKQHLYWYQSMDDIDKLRNNIEAVADESAIHMVYLFGSRAGSDARSGRMPDAANVGPLSDYDLGVLLRRTPATDTAHLKAQFGLTCSAGIAPNKLLAKLSGEMHKPDGLTIVHQSEVAALMESLPVQELCGIGPKTQEKLNRLGIKTCGELGRYPEKQLTGIFGINGTHLKRMGQGVDESPVLPYFHEPATKSMGHSFTLDKDTRDLAEIQRHLLQLSEQVGRRLRRESFAGRTVSLVLRYADFSTFIKQHSLKGYIDDGLRIYQTGMKLFEELYKPPRLVRLLGISVSNLVRDLKQTTVFENPRAGSLFESVDAVNNKYGEFSVARARLQERSPGPRVIPPSWRPTPTANR